MKLIATHVYPYLDVQSLDERQARDTLFRCGENCFLSHMTPGEGEEDQYCGWIAGRHCSGSIRRLTNTDQFGDCCSG